MQRKHMTLTTSMTHKHCDHFVLSLGDSNIGQGRVNYDDEIALKAEH